MMFRISEIALVALLLCCQSCLLGADETKTDSKMDAKSDLQAMEQKALSAAADRVAPSVVRIETIGGLERVDKVLFGGGPTTGVIVDPQGYIISSAFNFVNKPASILVRFADGTRKPARLVARDTNHMLVLLKIEADHPLPVPQAAPASEARVGQWCVAMGRTFEDERPNVSIGILSAVNRVWGKAYQTDAAVSPNNYGGPLVDIRGRVLGILVPLSPQAAEEMAGIEWYDSGIGFAVPLEVIFNALPRLKKGENLHAGVAGVFMKSKNLYTGDTVIASCRPNSPAARAGFKPEDRVVEIAGHKISRTAEVRQEIGKHYAGDKVNVVVDRGGKRIAADLELVDRLEPYRHGFLGVLPLRTAGESGIPVRFVYPDSPAAAAKIEVGDVLHSFAGKPIKSRDDLLRDIAAVEPGMVADLEVIHKGETRKVHVTLAELPEELPPSAIPPAHAALKAADGAERPKVGAIDLRVPEFKNTAWAYVPENYDPSVSYGVVVLLQEALISKPDSAKPDPHKDPSVAKHEKEAYDSLLKLWKPLCDAYDLVLVVPASNKSVWETEESDYIAKLIGQVRSGYSIDPTRIALYGHDTGAGLAYIVAFHSRDIIRAVATVDAGTMLPPPENEPEHRLAVYLAMAKGTHQMQLIGPTIGRLKAFHTPVTVKDLGAEPRDLTAAETAELVRWIDALDRI
jgi:serine protease Do